MFLNAFNIVLPKDCFLLTETFDAFNGEEEKGEEETGGEEEEETGGGEEEETGGGEEEKGEGEAKEEFKGDKG
jgi:hypothetical protein